ncbi:MAG: ABC transporter substrate-binding protein, partial [Gammaproteobacteria bacterium]|nr:ABC transporter substrate-binding protein [Gammaproteobacteria bacterium]
GAFSLRSWKANETVVLEANPDYRHGAPGMKRVILRHVPEPSAQRLLLEKADIDMARNLTPDQIKGIQGNADIAIDGYPKGTIVYMAANAAHPVLGKPKVVQALRLLADYRGMADSFLAGQFVVHQAFWPGGLWAAYSETPYSLDVAKAKALLAEAGHPDGFEVRIDTLTNSPFPEISQSLQATLSQAGIKAQIVTQEGKTLWPKYRARKHELILARWSPDYVDPHSNADAFAHNPDNRPEAKLTGVLAWRNAWAQDDINALAVKARNELDLGQREKLYLDLQKRLQTEGPYVILFQQNEQVARRKNLQGFVSGSNFDLVFYRNVTK